MGREEKGRGKRDGPRRERKRREMSNKERAKCLDYIGECLGRGEEGKER